MTLVLSNPSLDISNLIISNTLPAQMAPLHPIMQYLEAMSEIEDPANGTKTREQAEKVLETIEKVSNVSSVLFPIHFTTQDAIVRQHLLTNLILPDPFDASRTMAKFQMSIPFIKDSIGTLGTFPFSAGNGHEWAGRTLVIEGARSG